MTAPQTVADVLDAAADLLEKPGAWTQGEWWSCNDDDEQCFCVRGAIRWCGVGINSEMDQKIAEAMGFRAPHLLARWNDEKGRTQSEVVAALRAAATSARQETRHGE